jgi:hypothetical protein
MAEGVGFEPTVGEGFANRKDGFFKEIGLVVGMARVAELSTAAADEHIGILGQVVGLLPGEGTEFSKVEFNGAIGSERQSVVIEEATANRLRRAMRLLPARTAALTAKSRSPTPTVIPSS